MTVLHQDDWLTVHVGDVRTILGELEADSVQTVITSPPYYGLRDYGLPPTTWGGDPDHAHEWTSEKRVVVDNTDKRRWNHSVNGRGEEQPEHKVIDRQSGTVSQGAFCECGAWLGCLGLEPDPFLYLAHMVDVFRAVRRVLRPDGVVWLNVGDSYANDGKWGGHTGGKHVKALHDSPIGRMKKYTGFKPKDRMLMPARLAIALQDDGWWVRDEVIWHKKNPMPSSVTDRTTPAHEMVYLLSKRARYYYDADAIREPATTTRPELLEFGPRPDVGHPGHSNDRRRVKVPGGWDIEPGSHDTVHRNGRTKATYREQKQAQYADQPGSAARLVVGLNERWDDLEAAGLTRAGRNKRSVWTIATQPYPEAHFATFPEALVEPMILAGSRPDSVVLDPFGGSGTTAMVANRLGRKAVYIDLSPEYAQQAIKRIGAARGSGAGPAVDLPVPFAPDGLFAEAVP